MPFHKDIYANIPSDSTETPYSTWLRHTNEKEILLARLPAIFQKMRFSRPSPLPRGIHQFHRRFHPFIHPGENVISTYLDLARHLPGTGFSSFPSTVNVTPCHDPNSKEGHNLLTFFLERDVDELPQHVQDEIHFWFRTRFPKTMTHDVGIFVAQRI